jgi:hypothetical protein
MSQQHDGDRMNMMFRSYGPISPRTTRYAGAFDPPNRWATNDTDIGEAPTLSAPGAAAFSPISYKQPESPSIIPALQSQYEETAGRLRNALQPPQVSTPRALLGAFVSQRNPQLGDIIAGQYQYKRALAPLMQEYQLAGDELNRQMQIQNQAISNRLNLAHANYFEKMPEVRAAGNSATALAKRNTVNSQLAQHGLQGQWDDNGELGGVEAIPESQLSAVNQSTIAKNKASTLTAQQRLDLAREALSDKENYEKHSLALRQQGIGLSEQKFAQAQTSLNPHAQQVLMETAPIKDQIENLISQFEATKGDNTPGAHSVDRAKYAVGISSQRGNAADQIAQLELTRVAGAARVLKGSSRAIQALHLAMNHLPNVWVDSDKLIYDKLTNLHEALGQIENEAYVYGKKSGQVPANPANPSPAPTGIPSFGDWKKGQVNH